MVQKVRPKHLRQRKHPLGMAHRLEHLLAKKGREDSGSLCAAARTESPTFAGQGHQKLVVTLIAVDARLPRRGHSPGTD